MLEKLTPQPADALLALIKAYAADERADKIDLGVGVYRTASGETPVFAAIKDAERRLVDSQETKAYLGPEGDMGFVNALRPIVFEPGLADSELIDGMQTPGGTGAVRLTAALAQRAGVKRIVIGKPSWPNHAQIFADLDLEIVWFDHARDDGTPDMAALRAAFSAAGPADAVMLHGCCHNPTGIDYSPEQWREIASLFAETGVLPILDMAYQGLGDGLDADRFGVSTVLAAVPDALVAYSCDKNFGLYRERVGALYVQAGDSEMLRTAMSNGYALARASWSMPPDHGAAAVRVILEDDNDLAVAWREELDSMRERMRQVRVRLAEAGTAGSVDLRPLAAQNGLFATLPLSKEQVGEMRERHGVYMAGTGRINIAGLTMDNIDKFVAALVDVTG